jgi:hypothetical protein
MGGGGNNLSQLGSQVGNYYGSYANQPLLGQGGGGQDRGNQAQANYINAHGALPPGMGGTALNQGQQNFFANKGYLPPGFTGGTNYGFMNPGGKPPGGGTPVDMNAPRYGEPPGGGGGGMQKPYNMSEPPGSYNAQGGGGWDISQAFQHLFGGGTNFGPYTNWMS